MSSMSAEDYEILKGIVQRVAANISTRYGDYANRHDAASEMWVWLSHYGRAAEMVEALNGGDDTVVSATLWNVGRRYAEREKAHRVGYEPQDQAYYTEDRIQELLPYAQDESWDGLYTPLVEKDPTMPRGKNPTGDGADFLAQVLDIRRAAARVNGWDIGRLLNELGGERPFVGRRRVLSNREALVVTKHQDGAA